MQDTFAGASTLVALQTPAAIAANGYSPGTDLRSFDGTACVIMSSLNTAGTSPTLAVALQGATDSNLVGTVTYSGTGNGKLTEIYGGPDTIAENIIVTFSSATAFSVAGSVTGALGTGTVGTRFTCPKCSFLVFAGSTAFVNTDAFTVPMSARTYTNITAAAFTGLTTGGGFQRLTLNTNHNSRYLRAAYTIGGTVTPSYTVGLALMAETKEIP